MPNNSNQDNLRSKGTDNCSFFRIPRALVKDERFRELSTDAKLLYGLMLDRMGLSLKNSWHDAEGRAFIYFTLEEIQTTLSCGHNKAVRLMAELDQYDLIERVKQGQGKPAIICVKKIDTKDANERNSDREPETVDLQTSEKPTCRLPTSKRLDFPKGTEIILRRTMLSPAISIHPSILITQNRLHHHPKVNHLQPMHRIRTAPPKGGAVRASMSFVKHKRPLVRG